MGGDILGQRGNVGDLRSFGATPIITVHMEKTKKMQNC